MKKNLFRKPRKILVVTDIFNNVFKEGVVFF